MSKFSKYLKSLFTLSLFILSSTLFAVSFVAPPSNDTCVNAIPLTVGTNFNEQAIISTLAEATDTHGTGSYIDVWFTVVVPASGNITIETDFTTGSNMNDTVMYTYSGICGSMSSIEFDDNDGHGNFSKIQLSGQTPGDTLIIKVEEDLDSVDPLDSFQISAYEEPVPANDECANAIPLIVGYNFDDKAITTSLASATDTHGFDPTVDVWFTVVVPVSGTLTIETDYAANSSLNDTWMGVYSGVCGSIVTVENNDDDGNGNFSKVEFTGLTPGDVLIVKIEEDNDSSDPLDVFRIAAYDTTLPSNDICTNATALTVGTIFSDEAIVATLDGATDTHGTGGTVDVWFTVVIPASGNLTIETDFATGSAMNDTWLAVYSGTCGSMTTIENNDDDGNGNFSKIELIGQTPGDTLLVKVEDDTDNVDPLDTFQISAYDNTPSNDTCTNAAALTIGNGFNDEALTATLEGATDTHGTGSKVDVWFTVVVPASGNLTIETDFATGSAMNDTWLAVYSGACGSMTTVENNDDDGNGNFSKVVLTGQTPGDTLLVKVEDDTDNVDPLDTFQVSAYYNIPSNDLCANAIALTIGEDFPEQAVVATLEGATDTHGTGSKVDVWFTVVVPASGNLILETDFATGSAMNDTWLAVYSGACGSMTTVENNDDDGNGNFSKVVLTGQTPGDTLLVKVEDDTDNVDPLDIFQISAYDNTPSNDICTNAIALTIGNGFDDKSLIATLEGATDTHGGSEVDVWFTVVVPASGNLTIETDFATGSAMNDTWLAVYSGACGSMTTVENNDDDGNGNFSKVVLTGQTPGDILLVKVEDDTDNVDPLDTFQISAYYNIPSNDICDNAIALTVGADFAEQAIVATLEGATDTHGTGGTADVWFTVVVPASGNLVVETDFATGSAMNDTWLAIYSGICGTMISIDNNDDDGNGNFSKIVLIGQTPGDTLLIKVEDDTDNVDPLDTFQISTYDNIPANNVCASGTSLSVGTDFADEAIVTTLEGATDTHGGSEVDVWFTVVVPASGNLTIETDFATGSAMNDTWLAVYSGACGSMTTVENNDDDGNGNFSKVVLTGQTPSDILLVKVEDDTDNVDPLDIFQISAYDDTIPPPSNDICDNAIALTVGADFADQAIVATLEGATDTHGTGGTADVWFTVIVPASGNLVIETDFATGSAMNDTWMAVYSGACGSMTTVENNDDDGNGNFSKLVLTGQTPSDILLVKVEDDTDNLDPLDTFQISVYDNTPPPPSNDICDNATALTVGADFADQVIVATLEGATDTHGTGGTVDVWFTVIVPTSGNLVIETDFASGSAMNDTWLAVYSGVCGTMVSIDNNDDDGNGNFSKVVLTGQTPGDTLLVKVEDDTDNVDPLDTFQISAYDNIPSNNTCATATALTIGTIFSDEAIVATLEGATDTHGTGGTVDVWFTLVVPATGNITIETDFATGSAMNDTWLAVYSGTCGTMLTVDNNDDDGNGDFSKVMITGQTPGDVLLVKVEDDTDNIDPLDTFQISAYDDSPPPPANDVCTNAIALTVGADFAEQAIVATLEGATDTHGTGGTADVWFTVVVPASGNLVIETDFASGSAMNDTWLAVYSGVCGTMVSIDNNDDDGNGNFSKVILTGQTPGDTLLVKVEDDTDSLDPLDTFQISAYDNIPSNNTCATATDLTVGTIFSDEAIVATLEGATDTHGTGGTVDVWFTVVVPATGNITIETDFATGSAMNDTWLAVYSGVCGTMLTVDNNDDDGNGNFSKVMITGQTPGDTLLVKVEDDTDNVDPLDTFQISAYDDSPPPPANDTCMSAFNLTLGEDFDDHAIMASLEGATNTHGSGSEVDVWFKIEVPASGNLTIETDFATGSEMNDTWLAVYSGTCGSLNSIAIDDDNGNGNFSKIELSGQTPGDILIIKVEEDSDSTDPLDTFRISVYDNSIPPPTNNTCVNATTLTIGADFNDEAIVGTLEGATDTHGTGAEVDVWFTVMVPASGNLTIETDFASGSLMNDTWIAVYSGTCGSLNSIAIDDDNGNGNFSKIELSGQTPGNILIIKVEEDSDSMDPLDIFQISVYDETLGDNEFEIASLEIFPNPVSEVLSVKTDSKVDIITIYNMVGQEILRTTETQIDVRNLPNTTYIIKVQVGNKTGSSIFIKK